PPSFVVGSKSGGVWRSLRRGPLSGSRRRLSPQVESTDHPNTPQTAAETARLYVPPHAALLPGFLRQPPFKMPRPVLRVILAPPTDDNKGGINEPLTHRRERAATGRTGLRPAWRRSTGTKNQPRTT